MAESESGLKRTQVLRQIRRILEREGGSLRNLPWSEWAPLTQQIIEHLHEIKQTTRCSTYSHFASLYRDRIFDSYGIGSFYREIGSSQRAEIEEEVYRLYVMHSYYVEGARDFYIYSDLAELLRDTELPNIPISEIKLPYDAFSIHFGPGLIRYKEWNEMDRYVVQRELDRISILFFGDNTSGAPVRAVPCTQQECDAFVETWRRIKPDIEAIRPASLGVRDVVEFLSSNAKHNDDQVSLSSVINDSLPLLFNAIMYITSQGSDVQRDTAEIDSLKQKLKEKNTNGKPTRAVKELQTKLKQAQAKYIYIVGWSLAADEAAYVEPASAEGRRIMKRFRVRGHFRNQVCGPERKERRLTWVKPFWKGPEMAELINKGYVVKRKKAERTPTNCEGGAREDTVQHQ